MASSIPADLLELKSRLDAWREKRKHPRERTPDGMRKAIIGMTLPLIPHLPRSSSVASPGEQMWSLLFGSSPGFSIIRILEGMHKRD
jgi:hypothetical protein